MKKLSFIFTLTIALLAGCLMTGLKAPHLVPEQGVMQVLSPSSSHEEHKSSLDDALHIEHQAAVAVIAQGGNSWRVESNRSWRGVPTLLAKSSNLCNYLSHTFYKHLHSLCGYKARLESMPFATPNACDYYVYTLRHLLR